MKTCKHCNSQVKDSENFCSVCGSSEFEGANNNEPTSNNNYNNSAPNSDFYNGSNQGSNQPNQNDTGSFGWAVLGFFIPLVGLILFIVWKNTQPRNAKKSLIGAIVGFVFNIIISICYVAVLPLIAESMMLFLK